MHVSSSVANTRDEIVSYETQPTVAEHSLENRLGGLKLSEQADLMCWHNQLSQGVERDESARFTLILLPL